MNSSFNKINKIITKVESKVNKITEEIPLSSGIKEVGDEMTVILNNLQTRTILAESVISAYKDFETDYENSQFHKFSSRFEEAFNVFLINNPEAETKLISKIESLLPNLPIPKDARGNNFKNDLARLGLATLRVELKVFNINQETKTLRRINLINRNLLANKIMDYAEDLKKNVQINKANHNEVSKALSEDSLEGLKNAAKLINPNATNNKETIEQRIQDFLNGGDLKL